jgi:cobalt-zinc-cadmium efflux system outer membrane protein
MRRLYAALALTQADVYEATRLSNPQFGFARLATGGPQSIVNTTWSVSLKFVELLLLPMQQRLGEERLLASQQHVAAEVLNLENDVRAAYVTCASAVSIAELLAKVATAARLSARTAEAFHAAGNISELQLSRELAAAVEAEVEAQQALIGAHRSRSELLTLLGLAPRDPIAVSVLTPLPVPPILKVDPQALQRIARAQRLDLLALQRELGASERILAQQRWSRWVGDLGVGYEREFETGSATRAGPTASIGLPLFNSRRNLVLRARGQWEAAQAELSERELALENGAYAAMQAVSLSHDASVAMRDQLVPLRERITVLSQREFNYQFMGAFELLSIKREELEAYRRYIEAIRDEWRAHIEVQRIAGGKIPPELIASTESGAAP